MDSANEAKDRVLADILVVELKKQKAKEAKETGKTFSVRIQNEYHELRVGDKIYSAHFYNDDDSARASIEEHVVSSIHARNGVAFADNPGYYRTTFWSYYLTPDAALNQIDEQFASRLKSAEGTVLALKTWAVAYANDNSKVFTEDGVRVNLPDGAN